MCIFYMNTCTNTDSLGGPKESPERKVWPYNLRREGKKQSADRRDWPHFFFCFSIATLKTSHKLLPWDRSCLSIARLAFCWSHVDKIKVLASCTSYKVSSLSLLSCDWIQFLAHRTEVPFCWLLAGGHSASWQLRG